MEGGERDKMKHFYFIIVLLCLAACAPKGDIVATPAGLDAAVKDYVASRNETFNYSMTGMTVRAYPKDVYLVSLDLKGTPKETNTAAQPQDQGQVIAQKGVKDGQPYWQVMKATKENLKTYGIN